MKHSEIKSWGQSTKKNHFRESSVVSFILVTWNVQHRVVRRRSGWDHKEPAVASLKYFTSICLIRLEKCKKSLLSDLAEICARHLLNTCVVLPLHQLMGQQRKSVMPYISGAKRLGSMRHITLYKQTHHHTAMREDNAVHGDTGRHTRAAVHLPRSSEAVSILATGFSYGWNRTHC